MTCKRTKKQAPKVYSNEELQKQYLWYMEKLRKQQIKKSKSKE